MRYERIVKKRIAWGGAIVSLVAIAVLLWRVNLRELGNALGAASWGWLAASFGVFFVMFAVRSVRWAGLLGGTPFGITWHANVIGYMFNIILPLRLGEVARVWIIAERTDKGFSRALSGAVVERFLDLAGVLLIFAGLAQVLPMPPSFSKAAYVGSIALVVALVGLVAVVAKGELIEPLVRRVVGKRADGLLAKLAEVRLAFRAIANAKALAVCFVLTVVVWLLTAVTMDFCMRAFFPEETTLARAGLLLVSTNLSGAIPSAPGGAGIVQAFATSALVLPFGIAENRALACVLVLTLGQQLAIVLMGIGSMARLGTSFSEIRAGVDLPSQRR